MNIRKRQPAIQHDRAGYGRIELNKTLQDVMD